MKIEEYRNRFPIIKRGMNYQATCGIGILPDVGVQAIEDVKGTSTEIPEVNFDNFLNAHEELKAEFAKIINAEPGEIAIVPSTSAAACRILNSLDYEKRNKIVVSALSFPGISFACHAQQKRGAKISFVPSPQKIGSPVDYDNLRPGPADYEKSIDEKTILVVLTGTCYRTGFRQDKLREIVKIAHDKGAYVFIDDGQLSGHFVEDVKGSNVDFLASTTYKYLLCPTGNAFLYVKEKLVEKLESLDRGWFSGENFMESFPYWLEDSGHHRLSQTASRFELGVPRLPLDYISLPVLKMINEIGVKNIENYTKCLLDYYFQRITEDGYEGFETKSPYNREQRSHLTIKVPEAQRVAVKLRKYNTAVEPSGEEVIRIAPHFYNIKEEIDELLINLRRTLQE